MGLETNGLWYCGKWERQLGWMYWPDQIRIFFFGILYYSPKLLGFSTNWFQYPRAIVYVSKAYKIIYTHVAQNKTEWGAESPYSAPSPYSECAYPSFYHIERTYKGKNSSPWVDIRLFAVILMLYDVAEWNSKKLLRRCWVFIPFQLSPILLKEGRYRLETEWYA